MIGNILLTGGNSMLYGLGSKLSSKIQDIVPGSLKAKVITLPIAT